MAPDCMSKTSLDPPPLLLMLDPEVEVSLKHWQHMLSFLLPLASVCQGSLRMDHSKRDGNTL